MEPRSLLAAFAHPDDEAFGCGGSLAQASAAGTYVTLVCATRGEVGEISDAALATPETLGKVREGELRCTASALGIHELVFLDYRDSGMAGTDDNTNPESFINIPADDVIAKLVGAIRRTKPQVVVTFEPNGGYGHPDHIAIHKHTVAAFHAASDPEQYPEQGAPWQPERLFYTALPRSFFKEVRQKMEAAGMDTSQFASAEERGWPDEDVNTIVDVSGFVDAKWQGLLCHRTQFGDNSFFRQVSEEEVKTMMSREFYALVEPKPADGERLSGLFEGI